MEAVSFASALAVLPAKLRLEVQKTVNSDIEAQKGIPKQPNFSRAYSSEISGAYKISGLGVGMGAIPTTIGRTSAGSSYRDVTRHFPSTAECLASMLAQACINARKPLPTIPRVHSSVDGHETYPPSPGSTMHPDVLALAGALHNSGLDSAYRVLVARDIKRRLAGAGIAAMPGDPNWTKEEGRCPSAAKIASGELVEQVVSYHSQLINKDSGSVAEKKSTPASISASTTSKSNVADLDTMLDDALDEIFGD